MEERKIAWKKLFGIALLVFGFISIAMVLLSPALVERFHPLLPDQGSAWYYWQLPEPTVMSRLSSWGGYALHQLTVWIIIGLAMRRKAIWGQSEKVNKYSLLVLVINLAFAGLHLLQTHLFYDGIAQDVPIWTSQGSVIVMLVLMLYLQIPARGLFLGRSFQPPKRMLHALRLFHGPYISWALVYTFWFHPMEGNYGLVSGFIYMFLLFIQLSLFDTRLHFNRHWVMLLEAAVLIHAVMISVYKSDGAWQMFLFGFLAMFVFTQHFSWRKPRWVSALIIAAWVAGAAVVYGLLGRYGKLFELSFIPVALYGGTLGLLALGWLWDRIASPKTHT